MIEAVFDTTTLLQAAASRKGPAKACLALVDAPEKGTIICMSPFSGTDAAIGQPA